MEPEQESPNSLNSSQKLHLLASFQYVDKLLGEIELILEASASRTAFPKYRQDLPPAQAKIVRDYIARLRSQMIRALESQSIHPPGPQFGAIKSIRVTLGFAEITFDECRAKVMDGYGEVPASAVAEVNGLVDEMKGLVRKLDAYLGQGFDQDLQSRLEKLRQTGSNVALVGMLEHIVNAHGLVELRPMLSDIVSRLESTNFEIAVFGRVSSGKSSLLNRIVGEEILPVGVTPVTAVPTRIAYGTARRGMAWFATGSPQQFEMQRLREFVTEEFNPDNSKHVSRIVVELPSSRLSDGVTYVDTPGLGSLATAGAAETMAYLPRCDLGVVLIDAGAALSADDLATIRILNEAGCPALVLLSKSDLLRPDDLDRVLRYVAEHIRSELSLDLPVRAVSAKPEYAEALEQWFSQTIMPLYSRHAELARESVSRKIGLLSYRVEAALGAKLRGPKKGGPGVDAELRAVESDLRRSASRWDEIRSEAFKITDEIRESGPAAIEMAAEAVVDSWAQAGQEAVNSTEIVTGILEQAAAQLGAPIASMIRDLAQGLARSLTRSAAMLELDAPEESELTAVIKDMPRLDVGNLALDLRVGKLTLRMGPSWVRRRVQNALSSQAGEQIVAAFHNHGKMLEAWARRTLAELQAGFDSHAGTYRAQLDRLLNDQPGTAAGEDAIRKDLEALVAVRESGSAAEVSP